MTDNADKVVAESDDEAKLRTVYDLFNGQTDSPLYGLMTPSQKSEGKLSRVTFNSALGAVYESFSNSDAQRTYEVLRNYVQVWLTILRVVAKSTRLIANPTLFRAIMIVFPFVVGRVSDRFGRQFTVKNFEEILRPLQRMRASDLRRPGATHIKLAEGFRKKLEASISIGDNSI